VRSVSAFGAEGLKHSRPVHEPLLAHARARYKAALARSNRARSRTGRSDRYAGDVCVDPKSPFAWLFEGADPDDVIRDSRSTKKIFKIWKRSSRHGRRSNMTLPSRRKFIYGHDEHEVLRP
jgi:hypothetical protein